MPTATSDRLPSVLVAQAALITLPSLYLNMGSKTQTGEEVPLHEKLESLDADDVEEVRLSSSNVRIVTADDVHHLNTVCDFDNPHRGVKINGAMIVSHPGGTWQPFFTITTVEKFDYHRITYEGEIEEEIVSVNGKGEIMP